MARKNNDIEALIYDSIGPTVQYIVCSYSIASFMFYMEGYTQIYNGTMIRKPSGSQVPDAFIVTGTLSDGRYAYVNPALRYDDLRIKDQNNNLVIDLELEGYNVYSIL